MPATSHPSPLVSVIVPVYNASAYLRRCLDSVLAQDYSCWECLLVDDGSTDDSGAICEEYAALDARFRVFHQENAGVSAARNRALDESAGEWIAFVDSDDWVKPAYLSHLLDHASDGIELVLSYTDVYTEGGHKEERYPYRLVDDSNFELLFTEGAMSWHTAPWAKLYRADVVRSNGLRFVCGMHIGEDAVFVYTFMSLVKCVFVSSDTDYCYYCAMRGTLTKRVNPLSNELLGQKKLFEAVDNLITVKNLTDGKALNELSWLKATYVRRVLNALYQGCVKREVRFSTLKSLDLQTYITHIHTKSCKEQVYLCFLKHRLYAVYDMCRWLVAMLKNKR